MAQAKRQWKTTKKLSGGQKVFRKWPEYTEGDTLIGEFKGIVQDKKYKAREHVLLKVEDAFLADKNFAKSIKGKTLQLNGAGQLNKAVDDLEIGTMIQVVYNGTSIMQGGDFKGQESHLIEVSLCEEATEDGDDSSDDGEYYEDIDTGEESEDEEYDI